MKLHVEKRLLWKPNLQEKNGRNCRKRGIQQILKLTTHRPVEPPVDPIE